MKTEVESQMNREDIEYMNITPQFVYGLEAILNQTKKGYLAKFGNVEIIYNGKKPKGTLGNTTGAIEYEEFIIRRNILE